MSRTHTCTTEYTTNEPPYVLTPEEPKRFYTFTREELRDLLTGTVDMMLEYRDRHGKDEPAATLAAVWESLGGLDAEDELWRIGECRTTHVREGEHVSLLGRQP